MEEYEKNEIFLKKTIIELTDEINIMVSDLKSKNINAEVIINDLNIYF
jgi:hypothetical protein